MPNYKQPMPGHVAMLTNQMLVYKQPPSYPENSYSKNRKHC